MIIVPPAGSNIGVMPVFVVGDVLFVCQVKPSQKKENQQVGMNNDGVHGRYELSTKISRPADGILEKVGMTFNVEFSFDTAAVSLNGLDAYA